MGNKQTERVADGGKKVTVVRELIQELELIKLNKTKTLPEVIFFDAVIAIIESKYIQKEKEQMIDFAEDYDMWESENYPKKSFEQYYNETYGKE